MVFQSHVQRPIYRYGSALMLSLLLAGCESGSNETAVQPTSWAVRAERRAYDGAPPVIAHAPLGISCTSCHDATGREVADLGFAPANPHVGTWAEGAVQNCRQCHLFQETESQFAQSSFEGLGQVVRGGDRLYPDAPPVIPHQILMRENCLSCHSGPAARPQIRCTHPQRANCVQCHVRSGQVARFP